MGAHIIQCYIGFPTHDPSALAERLEQQTAELATAFQASHRSLFDGIATLHEAIDRALAGDTPAARAERDRGLRELGEADRRVTTVYDRLLATRRELTAHLDDTDDPFVSRERQFPRLDRDALVADLARHGVDARRDPEFQEMLTAVLDGGTCGGIRALEKEARRMQTRVRQYAATTAAIPLEPLAEFAALAHRRAAECQALCLPWSRFPTQCGYLGFLCEAALEQELTSRRGEETFERTA